MTKRKAAAALSAAMLDEAEPIWQPQPPRKWYANDDLAAYAPAWADGITIIRGVLDGDSVQFARAEGPIGTGQGSLVFAMRRYDADKPDAPWCESNGNVLSAWRMAGLRA